MTFQIAVRRLTGYSQCLRRFSSLVTKPEVAAHLSEIILKPHVPTIRDHTPTRSEPLCDVITKMDWEWEYIRAKELERERKALEDLAANQNSAFYLVNLAIVREKHQQWISMLPRIEPFYAVKCNPDARILSTLEALGTGFDCASFSEMEAVIDGAAASADRVIYANPCKSVEHLRRARLLGVKLMTFDNHSELVKIAREYPDAELILRILVDDSHAVCQMGQKYGSTLDNVPSLLDTAKSLNLKVRGISYHVGSGCGSAQAFSNAVEDARKAFDIAADRGFELNVLDVGGGFPGQFLPSDKTSGISFTEIAQSLRAALDKNFPEDSKVRLIGEPGRFYSTSSHTLAANVIGRREPEGSQIFNPQTGELCFNPAPGYMYYISDGLYGSFNCVLYDHVHLSHTNPPHRLGGSNSSDDSYSCSVWGPTCDGLDCVMEDAKLPLLEEGDWISFPDMGAYTSAAGSNFNGFEKPSLHYID